MIHQTGFPTSVTAKSVVICLCLCGAVLLTARALPTRAAAVASTTQTAAGAHASIVPKARKGLCGNILLPLDTRGKLATFLESEKAKVGVELGVQNGNFAETMLHQWSHNVKYYLIDIWAPLQNYLDAANVGKQLAACHQYDARVTACIAVYSLRVIELTLQLVDNRCRGARPHIPASARHVGTLQESDSFPENDHN